MLLYVQMCPEAAKFRIAPLQDEEDMRIIFDKNVVTNVTARVPPSSEDRASQSRINIDEVEGSGCEGEDETLVTPSRARGTKNKRCPYSPSPAATPRLRTGSGSVSRLDRVIDLIEKKAKAKEEEKSRNSVTSPGPGIDPVREEIRRMVALIVEDRAKPGSDDYFYATQLFLIKEYRDVFTCLEEEVEPAVRLDWIRRTWAQKNKA
jgi:hypothetical protein